MKLAISLVAVLSLCVCSVAVADLPYNEPVDRIDMDELIQAKKDAVTIGTPQPQQGGEDISTAVPIPSLPYSDSGNTAGALNDYDEACPFTGSTSPDLVYSYTPTANGALDISLCDSGYDTKVYVYENAAGNLVGCNDDACGSDGFRSELIGVPVSMGNTYYIVVDGYGGASGSYVMNVTENIPCVVDCPPGALAEGEVDCFDGYRDDYNAGCNSTPNSFTSIPCDMSGGGGVTVCGTYGGYFDPASGFNYRDTDWYSIDATANLDGFTFCVTGEYETLSGYINAALGCGAPVFEDFAVTGACDTACFNIPAGDYWLFVATSGFGAEAGACGGAYVMTLDGYDCPPVSVEPATWGDVKAKHR